MMYRGKLRLVLAIVAALSMSACGTLIAPYDETFDQSLNKLSDDTARFLAAASTGGPERSIASKETVAYYASSYNLLDRLAQRASLSRAIVPCPTDQSLKQFSALPTSKTKLPDDYQKFDCREFQLYAVRLYMDQLSYAHNTGGVLSVYEARATGGALQTAIQGAIQTFLVNKPSK
jgi:hypothetical protein